jgi:hypothetical protein
MGCAELFEGDYSLENIHHPSSAKPKTNTASSRMRTMGLASQLAGPTDSGRGALGPRGSDIGVLSVRLDIRLVSEDGRADTGGSTPADSARDAAGELDLRLGVDPLDLEPG